MEFYLEELYIYSCKNIIIINSKEPKKNILTLTKPISVDIS